MKLPTEVFGDVVVLHTPEAFSHDNCEQVGNFIREVNRPYVVLDLDRTENLDSAGLETLLDLHEELRALGGEMKISVTNASNATILRITRLDQHFEIFDSVVDAVKSFH